MIKRIFYSLLILSLFLIASVSTASAANDNEKLPTYLVLDTPQKVHQGETLEVKSTYYGKRSVIWDKWISGGRIYGRLKDLNNMGDYDKAFWENNTTTNFWGNAYFYIDTSNLEPGEYIIFLVTMEGHDYQRANRNIVFTVLPKEK